MHQDSPFATFDTPKKITHNTTTHVNFCDVCHYVWKSPAAAITCVNCKGNGDCARSLVCYDTDIPRT